MVCGIFLLLFRLTNRLFRLIQSLDYRVSIIQAQLSSLGEILDACPLVATLGTGNTSVIISLSQTIINLQGDAIVIYRL